jgi:toxin secretion/phage lysis holin|nr:MAG TPA: holin [Bacteriophage sp.]
MSWHIAAIVTAFIAMDIVTGIMQAVANKNLDSTKMRAGMWHKCGFIMVIILAALVEWAMQFIDLGFTLPLFVPVCVFIVLTEIVSIFENVCKLSPELANSKLAKLFNVDVK